MTRCGGVKRDGTQCTVVVDPPNAWCWHHDPNRAEQRVRAASKAGRSRPSRELQDLKTAVRDIIDAVSSGGLNRNDGQVMLQGLRLILDIVRVERGIHLEDELAAELEMIRHERPHAS